MIVGSQSSPDLVLFHPLVIIHLNRIFMDFPLQNSHIFGYLTMGSLEFPATDTEVDPQTPSSECVAQFDSAGRPLTLVFSDEFNVPGRSVNENATCLKRHSWHMLALGEATNPPVITGGMPTIAKWLVWMTLF